MNCKNCQKPFEITSEDKAFYQKINVPKPSHCPDCRRQRRMAWVNPWNLFIRQCDFTNQEIISFFPPESQYKVYSLPIYWSDKWSAMDYGRGLDFSRSFFDQWHELRKDVPMATLESNYTTNINSDYTNMCGSQNNCYMCFHVDHDENCWYSYLIDYCRNCMDCFDAYDSELCYEGISIIKCYNCRFIIQGSNCLDCDFCYNCHNCQNCYGCHNLRNKQFCINNEQKTKAEYETYINNTDWESNSWLNKQKVEFKKIKKKTILKYYYGVHNENVSGNLIVESKNAHHCYITRGAENVKFCDALSLAYTKEAYDYFIWGNNAELIYECVFVGESAYNIKFSHGCWPACHDLEYCMGCHSSRDCFGCCELRNARYCIFNKQYSKDEYFLLKSKIISQMKVNNEYGEFFPIKYSVFPYNDTFANSYYPLSENEVRNSNWQWKQEQQKKITLGLPFCITCQKNFKILEGEKEFYKRMHLPEPQQCFFCRNQARLKTAGIYTLYSRRCYKCDKEFETTISPDRPEMVYCKECYQTEIY
ncbi:MAG: hypothetical protein V1898_03235 [Patescibacteria group bacterium]